MARIIENIDVLPGELQESLRRAVKLFEDIESRLELFGNEKPSSTIYHYTNDAGLYGIIRSGTFHITDIASLNDPMENNEWINAYSVFANALYNKTPLHKQFVGKFSEFGFNRVTYALIHRFVACFSDHPDDLSQWRAYGDNGRGYMLAFDGQELVSAFDNYREPEFAMNGSFYVNYDKTALKSMHEEIADKVDQEIAFAVAKSPNEETTDKYLDMLFGQTWSTTLSMSLLFKDASYRNEREYRLLHLLHKGVGYKPVVEYKTRPHELVRYKSFRWRLRDKPVLKSVMIGPAVTDKLKSQAFVELCLREFHNDEAPKIALELSKVPYRV